MTPVGQRLFLVAATFAAFAVGTAAGSLMTYGHGREAVLAAASAAGETLAAPGLTATAHASLPATANPETDKPPTTNPEGGTGRPAPRQLAAKAAVESGLRGEGAPDGAADPAADLAVSAKAGIEAASRGDLAMPAALPAATALIPADPALTGATELAAAAVIAKAALTPRPRDSRVLTVRQGDSLTTIFKRAGIEGGQVQDALRSLRGVYDPRQLQPGQALTVTAAEDASRSAQLLSVALDLDFDHQLLITRDADGGFSTRKVEQAKRRELVYRGGEIERSLYLSAKREAVPNSVTDGLIRLFSWDVDFQRDIHPGDRFETLYEEVTLEKDQSQVKGELVYAGLTIQGALVDAYLFAPDGGARSYYDRQGRSLRKFLLRTPIDGARLSSGFGMRKHPVLGYSRMHKGIDFAAPRGTPVYAGGSGRIEVAGRNGSFGNYVRIRHSDTYSTAYGHLNAFAKGVKPGAKVRQGQVIAYVGTTGRSTGPHLHYEVLKNGTQINPLKMKQPPATQLAGAELQTFRKAMARIDRLRAQLATDRQVASRATDPAAR